MKSIFEEMGGTYILGADGMYYPNLVLPEDIPRRRICRDERSDSQSKIVRGLGYYDYEIPAEYQKLSQHNF